MTYSLTAFEIERGVCFFAFLKPFQLIKSSRLKRKEDPNTILVISHLLLSSKLCLLIISSSISGTKKRHLYDFDYNRKGKKIGLFISLIVLEKKHAQMYFKVTLIHS